MNLEQKSIRELDKVLWTIFSVYIRMRDSNSEGICKCITCPYVAHWKKMQAGHWIERQCKTTRFHEKNNNAQCFACNMYYGGRPAVYFKAIDEKWGAGTSEELCKLQEDYIRNGLKLEKEWFIVQIRIYKEKVKKLEERNRPAYDINYLPDNF